MGWRDVEMSEVALTEVVPGGDSDGENERINDADGNPTPKKSFLFFFEEASLRLHLSTLSFPRRRLASRRVATHNNTTTTTRRRRTIKHYHTLIHISSFSLQTLRSPRTNNHKKNNAPTPHCHHIHAITTGGLMRVRMSTEEGVTGRVKGWFGLSRAEDNRAARCLASCTLLNVILVAILAGLGAALSSSSYDAPPPTFADDDDDDTSSYSSWRSMEAPEHVYTTKGAVAADEPRCSEVGANVLREGGSAVDAAIATALCLGITHPHSSGVGGGAFMVIYLANGTSEVIEFREEAPSAASRDMFVASTPHNSSLLGGLAVAVPTELHGMRVAWERHGKLPWSRLVTPAANLADGFAVGKALAREIAAEAENLSKFPATAAVFLKPDGKSPLLEGDICKNTQLAKTLRRVAEEGPVVLREGALAESLAGDIRAAGGIVTSADLAQYRPRIVAPLRASALGFTLLGMPPPSSGGAAVAQVLEFLGRGEGRFPSS